MSRSGYSDDLDPLALGRYRAQVASAIRGKRGQAFMRDLVAALDALPEKRLIARKLESSGNVCAIGSVGLMRGIDMSRLDPDDCETVAAKFDIADQLAREVVFENDEASWHDETPEKRWQRMGSWAAANLRTRAPTGDNDGEG